MKKGKKYWIVFSLLFIVLLGIGGTYCYSVYIEKEEIEEESVVSVVPNFLNLAVEEVQQLADSEGILLKIEYQYHEEVEENRVISQELSVGSVYEKGDICTIFVSKGVVPVSVYEEYQVNELGNVPIMMYHGIVNIMDQETEYVGGNVDKDGYQRTVESFRKDLEFYYQSGYRMIRLMDYVEGNIDVELGYSPIVLTFDDGSENNFKVLGEKDGELVIDPNCAIGVLEEFKERYPDYGVTATFFVNSGLFQQDIYNEKILKWLVDHGYDVGNHTMTHVDFTKVDTETAQKEVGGLYQLLERVISSQYVPIVALPFGSPYRLSHSNYEVILKGNYLEKAYETKAALRVGWEAEVSCFDKSFQPQFLKRIRAYDNGGSDFDIEYNFKILENKRYISDGDVNTVVILEKDKDRLGTIEKKVKTY